VARIVTAAVATLVLTVSLAPASAQAAQFAQASIITGGERLKDSFYFVDAGTKHLAVSDLGRGGVSLFTAAGGNDSDYRFTRSVIGGNHYAPTVVDRGGGNYWFVTTEFAFGDSRLLYFSYNVRDGSRGAVRELSFSGGGRGLTDATVWYEPGKGWYLVGARWRPGYPGSRLVWARADSPVGPYSALTELRDAPSGGRLVDYDARGAQVDYVVEAPIWSWWDHNGDGRHELYWSIGPSDPAPGGNCSGWVKAIRRGDVNFAGDTPWIYVFGPDGGDGDVMAGTMDCYHLTHPDFTAAGAIRATSWKNGQFVLVNTDRW
jgi:hypothetical protein